MSITAARPLRFATELTPSSTSGNPLDFADYSAPAPEDESVRTGIVRAPRGDYVLIECDFRRSGGTMGVVAGEAVVQAYHRATSAGLPVGMIVSSGGARLQEGFLALMQMGRTASAAASHRAAGLRSAAAFRSPTTGGVFASWANTADFRAASPGAVIGFGGPRVVEAVTGTLPPSTSNNAESAYRDGLLDALVTEEHQQEWIEQALGLRAAPLPPAATALIHRPVFDDPWQALLSARDPATPSGMDWVGALAEEWTEIRGSGPCFRAGVARIDGREAVVIAMERDRTSVRPALPTPADFRLAQRAVRFADRVGLPLVTLIDTPGADPSPSSEREALAREISHTLLAMAELRTASVAVCVGEGGSGGAMALAHADTLFALESSVFAVIGPEAGAAVLYRDRERAPELARSMRIGATQLLEMGVIDAVLPQQDFAVRNRIVDMLDPARIGCRRFRPDRASAAVLAAAERDPVETARR